MIKKKLISEWQKVANKRTSDSDGVASKDLTFNIVLGTCVFECFRPQDRVMSSKFVRQSTCKNYVKLCKFRNDKKDQNKKIHKQQNKNGTTF